MFLLRVFSLPLALALLLAAPARAQNLLEVFEAAYNYDAAVLSARALAKSAEYRAAQSEALGLPNISAQASATSTQARLHHSPDTGRDQVDSRTLNNTTGEAKIAGSYPLFHRANTVAMEQARKNLDAAMTDLENAEQDLIIRVSTAYFDVLGAQDTLAAVRAAKAAFTEQLASAKRNFEVGTATITDAREAQARADLATAQEIAALNDLSTRRIALDRLAGRPGIAPKPLVTPAHLPTPLPADAELWAATADATHPAIRRARLVLEVASLETERARAAEIPTVHIVGEVVNTRSSGSLAQFSNVTNTNASLGLQLNVPLYTGGAITNRISETVALEERARQDLEAARRNIGQLTRQAYYSVQSLLAQVKALEAAESSSRLALESTQLGYRVGVRVNIDVLNAQTQLYQTQNDLARARYDVIVGTLRLRQASGQVGVADVQTANKLLAP